MVAGNNPKALLVLPEGGSDDAAEALRRLAGVDVRTGLAPALITEDRAEPLEIRRKTVEDVADVAEPTGAALWIVDGILDRDAQARLEDARIAFVDAAGTAWVPGYPRSSHRRHAEVRTESRSRLRARSLLMAQWLADHPDKPINAPALAARADAATVTAKQFLKRLERLGLVSEAGRGRAATRTVPDATRLRAWLAETARPSRVERISCFFRDPLGLPAADVPGLTLTGAAGAERIGIPVLSQVARPIYRVGVAGSALEDVPAALGGTRVSRGANAILLADPHGLGARDAREVGDLLLAPPSRIMLDLFLEPRGEAAAELFLELWQDRVL